MEGSWGGGGVHGRFPRAGGGSGKTGSRVEWKDKEGEGGGDWLTERKPGRQTGRQTDRQIHKHRQTDTYTGTHRDTPIDRRTQTEISTGREADTDTE